jgi:hypothetical protein
MDVKPLHPHTAPFRIRAAWDNDDEGHSEIFNYWTTPAPVQALVPLAATVSFAVVSGFAVEEELFGVPA